MLARTIGSVRIFSTILGAACMFLTPATAGQPVHSVRGHAIATLVPTGFIDQISISGAVDEAGVITGGISVWPSTYLSSVPDTTGWMWVIRLTSLQVTGNVAQVGGVIIFDNRHPEINVGCPISFRVTDNGSGASDPADILELGGPCAFGTTPLLGGNFTVR